MVIMRIYAVALYLSFCIATVLYSLIMMKFDGISLMLLSISVVFFLIDMWYEFQGAKGGS